MSVIEQDYMVKTLTTAATRVLTQLGRQREVTQ